MTAYCANDAEPLPLECSRCRRLNTQRRVARYSPNSIRRIRASLFMFFEWAVLARRSIVNPVECQIIAPEARIQHYPIEILTQIASNIVAADSEPNAALMLYLILFHLATVQEIRRLRVPEMISLTTRSTAFSLVATAHLTLPRRQPSLRIVHPGWRPAGQIIFHEAAQPWLPPLLARFDTRRAAITGPRCSSRYVFVSSRAGSATCP